MLLQDYFQNYENKKRFHSFGNRLVKGLINFLFKSHIRDIMTGYRAFSYDFVKTFPVLSKGFEIETEMTIHALDKNMLIQEIEVQYRDRPDGSVSKVNTFKDGFVILKTLARLFKEYKPMAFFGCISFLLLVLSFIFGVPVFIEYFQTGLVHRFPTLFFSLALLILSLLSFVCGIILEVVCQKHRQLFELIYIHLKK